MLVLAKNLFSLPCLDQVWTSSYYRCMHSILLMQKGNPTVLGSGHCLVCHVPTCWLEDMPGRRLKQSEIFCYVAVVHYDLLCHYGTVINVLKYFDQYLISNCYSVKVCVCCWWFGFVCLFFQNCFFLLCCKFMQQTTQEWSWSSQGNSISTWKQLMQPKGKGGW